MRVVATAWLASVATNARATPIEAYGRLPSVDQIAVSPSGARLALVAGDAAARQVQIRSTDDLKPIAGFAVGDVKLVGLQWADDDHLMVVRATTASVFGLSGQRHEWLLALDFDVTANKLRPLLSNQDQALNVIADWPQARRIGDRTTVFLSGISFPNNQSVLTLYRQGLGGGLTQKVMATSETTNQVLIDATGEPVARVDYDQRTGTWSLHSRRRGDGGWRQIAREIAPIDRPSLEGFGRTEDVLIVQSGGEDGDHYREIPLSGGAWSPPIAALDGTGLITDPSKRTVIGGARDEDNEVRYAFLDPKDQAVWDRIVRAFPGETVRLASWNDDRSMAILQVEGRKSGAAYYRLDLKTRHADWIADEYQGIAAADIAEVRAIRYKAADGREIPAYLTLPRGGTAKGLPLVVLAHGGPAARDEPGFDWWAQGIASLGYAVLQPQFRGSEGFGRDHLVAGYGQWGRKMQTDLSDGVAHLVGEGIVDAKHVCIVGGSYGGYAAMAGVTLQSGVYSCAVAVAGVSDLHRMLANDALRMGGSRNSTLRYWRRFMGVETGGDAALDALSPERRVDRLSAPLLLIHGTDDTVVPYVESRSMAASGRRAGKPVQLVTLAGEDHNLSKSSTRLQMLTAMADFLHEHLSPAKP